MHSFHIAVPFLPATLASLLPKVMSSFLIYSLKSHSLHLSNRNGSLSLRPHGMTQACIYTLKISYFQNTLVTVFWNIQYTDSKVVGLTPIASYRPLHLSPHCFSDQTHITESPHFCSMCNTSHTTAKQIAAFYPICLNPSVTMESVRCFCMSPHSPKFSGSWHHSCSHSHCLYWCHSLASSEATFSPG